MEDNSEGNEALVYYCLVINKLVVYIYIAYSSHHALVGSKYQLAMLVLRLIRTNYQRFDWM